MSYVAEQERAFIKQRQAEGIKLAKSMEKELEKVESKIQILMNEPSSANGTSPELDLFTGADSESGTSGEPTSGTRQ